MKTLTSTLLGFVFGLAAHFGFITWRILAARSAWVDAPALSFANLLERYYIDSEYIIGISVACSFAFATFVLRRTVLQTQMKLAAAAGAGGFSTFMAVFGCFLVGCCGSPMLAVYAGIFGAAFAPLAKWLTLVVTLASIAFGFWWIRRNEKKCLSDCTYGLDSPSSDL
ncbi:MAG: hypothetical protein ONA90_04530 [candidate division KSB1 bacterium]|nr:hypothetical protein [candidate division KSB1 bacterium]